MGCSHCLSSCTENGYDMKSSTFENTIKFLHKINPMSIIVSGGEPTLYPGIIHILRRLNLEFRNSRVVLCSNGTFTDSEYIMEHLRNVDCIVQIMHDPHFYPLPIDLLQLSSYELFDRIIQVNAYGRAIENNLAVNERHTPYCLNMRSLLKHVDFISANKNREANFKFCSWSIAPNGDILLSESMLCPPVGNINDPLDVIENNIRNFKCLNCVYAQRTIKSDPVAGAILK